MVSSKLKLAGFIAGLIIVVGIVSLLTLTPAGRLKTIGGTSADVGDIASGQIILISRSQYQDLLDKLRSYANADETTRSAIIQEAIHTLEGLSY